MRVRPLWFAGVGAVIVVWGIVGVVQAGTDSTCYLNGYKNVGGNWIGPPTSEVNCNTLDCPSGMGGTGACQVLVMGASSRHPGYNYSVCACSATSAVRCELIYYENASDSGDFFYECPPSPACADVPLTPECSMNGSGTGPYTCSCK